MISVILEDCVDSIYFEYLPNVLLKSLLICACCHYYAQLFGSKTAPCWNNRMYNINTRPYFSSMGKGRCHSISSSYIFYLFGDLLPKFDLCVFHSGEDKLQLYWSTETLLNDLHNHLIRPGLISSSEVDTDRNGLMDRYTRQDCFFAIFHKNNENHL